MKTPDYSIVIPAYNEEVLLPSTLANLQAAMQAITEWQGEIVVADNNSSDRTGAVAAAAGARVVFEPINQISRARNCGAAAASSPWLVFVDADTRIPVELLRATLETLAAGKVCGGGADVGTTETVDPRIRRTFRAWNWLAPRLKWAAGSYVFCLKQGWLDTGGFSTGVYASEEIWFSKALRKWGRRRGLQFAIIPIAVDTSMRKVEWFGVWGLLRHMLLLLLCPFLVRSRRACHVWYERPPGPAAPP